MHRRTKALQISAKTKKIVYERDGGLCIFCHRPGDPVAHVIARSHGGLGIEQNIVTACAGCHTRLDNSTDRQTMLEIAKRYLRAKYEDWKEEECIYKKWG